ncbi:A/G-specific adenine glycosylase, variant 1 [Aphanomyces invadans]|uniref:Adenine DNA glycosylase n=1 Tax=Aphanomyces invadans TaxID=157072 RepID=A0A024TT89_9STRA|nr:A/G-specific adenine glycosylase, variant 1 [Aphanomyces invadans]ETV96522.1 A/G-specific adenine glycosylase, variant 1 [Aphanomyces invadans]|eukprot:XP_008874788.1 A/G-specific adenine glycosylase, variant 1 [Aphanomyces invadans]
MKHNHAWKATEVAGISSALLKWYDTQRRCLPWRGDSTPYLVRVNERDTDYCAPNVVTPYGTWVSEIMCQQTRVDTVVAYYTKWMDTFPTVQSLAAADPDQVNAVWAGLGYYRRARMLHQGAQFVMDKFNGNMPHDIETLKTIPGIGPYTAGAIASVAFNQAEPLVDGNVIRVISRLRAIGGDPNHKPLIKFCWESGKRLIDPSRPGDFNQALMELGATVCSIQTPACATCPVQSFCHAYAQFKEDGSTSPNNAPLQVECAVCDLTRLEEWGVDAPAAVTKFPLKTRKKAPRSEVISVAVVYRQPGDTMESRQYLMAKRSDRGLLAGQWEFLTSKATHDSDNVSDYAMRRTWANDGIATALSIRPETLEGLIVRRCDRGELVHVFSHVKHHMGVEEVEVDWPGVTKQLESPMVRWMSCQDMAEVGITTGMKKVLNLVVKADSKARAVTRHAASSRHVKPKVVDNETRPITAFFQFAAKSATE